MKHNNYYPLSQAAQVIWLTNFCNKLPGYVVVLGLSPAQAAAAAADCGWLIYNLQSWFPATRAWAKACTDAVLAAQTGTGGAALVLPVFTAPVLPTGVVPMPPGALDRLFALIQLIKDSDLATDAISSDLVIVGTAAAGPNAATLQAVIQAQTTTTGVELDWNWGGFRSFLNALYLQVDRGGGAGFVTLVHDTTPGYKDTEPYPGTLTRWTYRAIYIVDDVQVGVWSNPVSVVVGG